MNSLILALCLLSSSPVHRDTLVAADGSSAGFWAPAKGSRPLVIWLHGGMGANNPAKGLVVADGFAKGWGDTGAFALLAPSAWPASPWWSEGAERRILQLVDQVAGRPGVDASRIVLAGVSDGGSGALWLAARLRAQWGRRLKAVAVWSCDPDVMRMQGIAWSPDLVKGLPLRWTAGGRDHLYPMDRIRWWWTECDKAGVSLERHENPLADHDLAFHQPDLAQFPAWVRRRSK